MKTGVTMLASGSNGNCIAVSAEGHTILIDCGISLRMLRSRMKETGIAEESVRAILVTHRHDDHVKGLEKATEHFAVPVFAPVEAASVLRKKFPGMMPATMLETGGNFTLSGFQIHSFPVEHDVQTVGYTLARESSKIGVATDMGRATVPAEFHLRDCNTLVLESNYDVNMLVSSTRRWDLKQRICNGKGHLSNLQNTEMLPKLLTSNTRNLILAHVSQECNKYEIALEQARKTLMGLQRQDLFLDCGRREGAIPTVWC